jgi:threonine synthase
MRAPISTTVTLGEGSTPLVPARALSERLGLDIWLKLDLLNPTGSFKDRGMAVAVSRARDAGARAVICASTGNTAASATAYAARAGLVAVVLEPEGAVASGKLAQALALGARVLEVRGSFDEALSAACELGQRGDYVLVNSLNPDRIEGQASAAHEIAEELGGVPDVLALPFGGGGNTRAYHRGFTEAGAGLPRIVPVQAAERATTVASAIRIAAPAHAAQVEEAIAASGGQIVTVSDEEILRAWRELGRAEGVFCEPASAAGVAGLAHAALELGMRVVCVITGHGLKDPESAAREAPPPVQVDADPDAIAAAIERRQ